MSQTPVRTIALKAGNDRFSDVSNALDVAVYKLQVQPHTISKDDLILYSMM
eukprot:SAG31_NODE_328_length_17643_cov_46.707649_5_plen_51_part_00